MSPFRWRPQEDARDARGARWIDAFASDLRFAFRYFARNRLTTVTIVAVLALGIGANTVLFSALQAEFVRPAPAVPKDASHVRIHALQRPVRTANWQATDFTYPELQALAARSETFHDVAGWLNHDVVIDAGDSTGARGVNAGFVTPNFFRALGVPLHAGPGLEQRDAAAADLSIVLSHRTASLLYGTAGSAVGRSIAVNTMPMRIVGVAPPEFQGAVPHLPSPALWMPVSARADIARASPGWLSEQRSLSLFARLAAGASHEQATAVARQVLARALPDSATRTGMTRIAFVQGMRAPAPFSMTQEDRMAIAGIGFVGLLVLLVACTNVSSLMIAAAVARRHEIAVRLTLGATRGRLLQQLLTESTLLAVAGGALGLTLFWWFAKWLEYRGLVGRVDFAPDVGTFVFMMAFALGTGVVFGLSPAMHATRVGAGAALKDSGMGATRRSRLQRSFVVAQLVCSQPLLLLLAVAISIAFREHNSLPEAVTEKIVSTSFRPLMRTGAPSQRAEAVDSLVSRIAANPQVVSVVPGIQAYTVRKIATPASEDGRTSAMLTRVNLEGMAPGYFALLDIPLLLGRDVAHADTADASIPVVIGSDLARALWGTASPVGEVMASPGWRPTAEDSMSMTVVGVYDAERLPERSSGESRVFTAHGRQWRRDMLLVRTRGHAQTFIPELRQLIRREAPGLAIGRMMTLAQVEARESRSAMQAALGAGGAGALGLLLASVGIYGVISLAVNQRRREIGVRLAVGARPESVVRMFLASGMRLSAIGLAIGLPLSILGLRFALSQGLTLEMKLNEWIIGAAIGAALLLVATVATWAPARRASRIDPATTLRAE